jgi:CRISPR/Cas system-associated protein endoribonuclease Cas2
MEIKEKRKRKITTRGVLRLIGDVSDYMLPMDWVSVYRRAFAPKYFDLEDYFPSEVHRTVARLERKGWVEKKEVSGEIVVALTEKGKKQLLVFDLETLAPKEDKWDGKWRMVFFDIESKSSHLRDRLRRYLVRMGFKQYQESVWVSPYGCDDEIKYIREVLEAGHGIKLAVVESLENDEDLREWFGLGRD